MGDHAAIAAGAGARASNIDADEMRALVAQIEQHVPGLSLTPKDSRDLDKALSELKSDDDGEIIEPVKARRLLGRILDLVGKAGDTMLTAGIRVVVEQWMKAHGIAP